MKRCSVFMDVEDPINPLADDAARDLAHLFSEAGVRGSFCVTGEKCRVLRERGREDVVTALLPHCLGLHTDTHSYHPTTMELLADVPFDEGCERAASTERKGFDAFMGLFRRKPSFWGGAGNTWSPEITETLKGLGIPAYSYALTALPDHAVHRFNGVVGLPQALSIAEDEWADDLLAARASQRVLDALRATRRAWTGIFVGHPTRFRYSKFWDVGYFAGQTPEKPVYVEPVSQPVYERSKRNLAEFLGRLRNEIGIVGVDEALGPSSVWRPANAEELEFFRTETARQIRSALKWPIHRPDLTYEGIVEKTLRLAGTVEVLVRAATEPAR